MRLPRDLSGRDLGGHGDQPTQRDLPFELPVGTLNALVNEVAEAVGQNLATGRLVTAL